MRLFSILLAVAVLVAGFAESSARTWIVAADGQGDFDSVTVAVQSATGADTVLIRPGTYSGWVRVLSEKSGMLIKGDGPVDAIIIQSDTTAISVTGTDPAVRIENLTLTGGSSFGAFFTSQARVEFVGCWIIGNIGPGDCGAVGGGGRVQNQSDVLVEDCLFENNHAWEAPGGLIIWSSRADIRGNIFRDNSACYGGGLEMYHCEQSGVSVIEGNVFVENRADEWGGGIFTLDSSPVIRRNSFVGNGRVAGAAVWVLGGSPRIHHNIMVDSNEAIHCQSHMSFPPSTPEIGENICWSIAADSPSNCPDAAGLMTADPLFCDPPGGDFGLCADSPAIVAGEAIFGALGMGCATCGVTPNTNTQWGDLKALFR